MKTSTRIPTMMGWEITRQCNLACPHCFSAASRKGMPELTFKECRDVIRQVAALGVKTIGWTGGEPLLRADLEEIIIFAKGYKIRSGITTNGILLDEKRAKSLKKAGVKAIQISVDGSTAEKNAAIRGATAEDFSRITEAIRVCLRLDFDLSMAMLIGQENLDDAPRYIEWAKKEGVKCVRFCGFTPWGRGKAAKVKERLAFSDPTKLMELKKFAQKAVRKRNPVVLFDPGFGPMPPKYEYHECVAGREWFYLTSFGDVYPCTALLAKEFKVGNIREKKIADIWNDPKMDEMSRYPRENIVGFCRDCSFFANCRGACRGATYMHAGSLDASFPYCLSKVLDK
jgi:radical SAM protein with 4Fe4S-binding SPASM domain